MHHVMRAFSLSTLGSPLCAARRALLALGLLVAVLATAAPALAQQDRRTRERLRQADSTETLAVRTRDGSTFVGQVVERDSTSVRMRTRVGVVVVPLADVARVDVVRRGDVRGGTYWFPSPNHTRLLFAPTGRMLARGDGYLSDYQLLFPGVAFGVTDAVTVGGGFSLIPGLGLDEQLFYLTPKVGLVRGERLNVAVGALIATVPAFDDFDPASFGILYGVATYGGPNASVTGGVGYGYATGEGLTDRPALLVGGERRVSRRVALISENYVVPGVDDPILSGGVRLFGEQLAVDLALVFPLGAEFAIPFVGFVFNF